MPNFVEGFLEITKDHSCQLIFFVGKRCLRFLRVVGCFGSWSVISNCLRGITWVFDSLISRRGVGRDYFNWAVHCLNLHHYDFDNYDREVSKKVKHGWYGLTCFFFFFWRKWWCHCLSFLSFGMGFLGTASFICDILNKFRQNVSCNSRIWNS